MLKIGYFLLGFVVYRYTMYHVFVKITPLAKFLRQKITSYKIINPWCACAVRVTVVVLCVCVCVWGVNDQKEFGIYECEKGKGKEDVRCLSASVMNSPSPFVQGYIRRCGHCVGLCKGHPPWHMPTEFVWYITMYGI